MPDSDDLTPGYREVVEYLEKAKLANPKQVASATGRSDKAAQVMLTRMMEDGFVVRPLRGHYCLPELAEELDLPVETGQDESSESEDTGEQVEAVSNPLTGSTPPGQKSMGFEEGKRRSNVAKVAKTLLDAKDAKDSGEEESGGFSGKMTARSHPWWPMRTDLRARIRWWLAEKLAHGIVALIPQEELPSKQDVYYGS